MIVCMSGMYDSMNERMFECIIATRHKTNANYGNLVSDEVENRVTVNLYNNKSF